MMTKLLIFTAGMAALIGLVWQFPFLWELAVAGMIGGVYWVFFHQPPSSD